MPARIVNGRAIASSMKAHLKADLTQLTARYRTTPTVATVSIGRDPASDLYRTLRDAACTEVGIRPTHVSLPADSPQHLVLTELKRLNADPSIQGVLVQLPVPRHLPTETILSAIDPRKDVEGLTPLNLGKTFLGIEELVPCTPKAVLTILDSEGVALEGADVVVVNHSTVVGRPLACLLLRRNASVSVCHVYTKDLQAYTAQADIVVSAAGVPGLITASHVKDQAVVVDVGTTPTPDGVKGDVAAAVKDKARILTPVPGGVGPVTIAEAVGNMVKTYTICMQEL